MYTVPRVSGAGADGGWGMQGKRLLISGQRDADRKSAAGWQDGPQRETLINSLKASHQAGDTGTGKKHQLCSQGAHIPETEAENRPANERISISGAEGCEVG